MTWYNLYRSASVAAVVCAWPVTGSHAQQPNVAVDVTRQFVNAEQGATLDQLVVLALERSPVVLAARSRVQAARGDVTQSALRPNPTLSGEWRNEIGGRDGLLMLGLDWPLDLFSRDARVSVAAQRVLAAEQQAIETERVLAAEVRRKVLQVLAAVRQLEIRAQVTETTRQMRELLAARAKSGEAPPLDRDMADVEARRAEAEQLRQRGDVEAAVVQLKALVGLPRESVLVLRDSLETIVLSDRSPAEAVMTDAAALKQAVSARPDVRLAEREVAVASAQRELLRSEARPEFSVTGSYMRMNSGFPLIAFDAAGHPAPIRSIFHNVSIGATVTLPTRDKRQGAIAAATASEQAAEYDLEARRLAAAAELDAAWTRAQRAEEARQVYAPGLRELARRNLAVTRQSYELGRATLIDVLSETRRYLEVETAYTVILQDIQQARMDVRAAMGVIR